MFIKSLDIENWKCFEGKLHLDFSKIEVFSLPNGTGKTSIFDAIKFAVFGKTDGKLESYQNHDGQTVVEMVFLEGNIEYTIHREFPKTHAILYKDGIEFKKGIKEIFEWVNDRYNYQIIKRIWFSGDIADNEILNFNFFKTSVLADVLQDASLLLKSYNKDLTVTTKELNSIVVCETRSTNDIKHDIESITKQLKKRTNISDSNYNNALNVKNKVEELKQFTSIENIVPQNVIQQWDMIDLDTVESQFEEEKNKPEGIGISTQVIRSVINANNQAHRCVCCDGVWDENKAQKLQMYTNVRDNDKLHLLKQQIEFKNSFKQEDIETSKKYWNLKSVVDANPNYGQIIQSYNKKNDLLWQKLDNFNEELRVAQQQEDKHKRIKELEEDKKKIKTKISILKQYLNDATEYYTNKFIISSSKILNELDSDYNNISVEDGTIVVYVRGRKLYITQMSKGERTLVAYSIILALRNIFAEDLPLIFDESFAALDEEHEYAIMKSISKSQEQVFIITHSPRWINSYFSTDYANIRKSFEVTYE